MSFNFMPRHFDGSSFYVRHFQRTLPRISAIMAQTRSMPV